MALLPPQPCLVGRLAQHQPYAITPKPVPPFPIAPSLCPCYPSSHLLPASSLSTIDPVPEHRSSTVLVITSILASLGTVLAAAVLSAVGYGSGWGCVHGDPGGTPSSLAPSAERWG